MGQESKIGKRTMRATLVLLVLCLAMCVMPYVFSQSDAAEHVVVPAYTVGNRSSAKYGTNETYGITGLQIALAPQESITFNTLIALEDIDPAAPLIEANVTPSFKGTQDFRRLFFTFADALNPEIFFTVQYRNWENESKTVVSAMANGQDYSSVEWYTGKIFHGKDEWHTTCQYAFSGVYTDGREHADRPIRIWYDDKPNSRITISSIPITAMRQRQSEDHLRFHRSRISFRTFGRDSRAITFGFPCPPKNISAIRPISR